MNIMQITFKRIASLLVSLYLSVLAMQVQAESNAQTRQFGRLFSKPTERNNLNILRQNQKLKTVTANEAEQPQAIVEAAPLELPDPITLQGYVKRNDGGGNTLWINGKAVQENSKVDSVKIGKINQRGFSRKGESTEGVDVKIPANGKQIRLKAGQMYTPEDNKIYEMQVVEKSRRLNLEKSGAISDSENANNSSPDNSAE